MSAEHFDDDYPFADDPDPSGMGWEDMIMDQLVAALEKGEEPPKSRIKSILGWTMRTDIPRPVREYLISILDEEKSTGKVGRQGPSLLDRLFPSKNSMFPKEPEIKALYYKLTQEEGYSQTDAFDIIVEKFKHQFRKNTPPSYETIRKIVYSKKW